MGSGQNKAKKSAKRKENAVKQEEPKKEEIVVIQEPKQEEIAIKKPFDDNLMLYQFPSDQGTVNIYSVKYHACVDTLKKQINILNNGATETQYTLAWKKEGKTYSIEIKTAFNSIKFNTADQLNGTCKMYRLY